MENKETPITEFGNLTAAQKKQVDLLFNHLLAITQQAIKDNGGDMRTDMLLYAIATISPK